MLIKKLYIMKGVSAMKSVLKISLLEKGYAEIDLQTHFAYGENYTFILKSGTFVHIEAMHAKGLKRKLQPFSLEGLCTGIAKDGKIIMWYADTPRVPYCLVELAEKYTSLKVQSVPDVKKQVSLLNERESENTNQVIIQEYRESSNVTEDKSIIQQSISQENKTSVADNDSKENVNANENVDDLSNQPIIVTAETSENDITADFNILSIEGENGEESNKNVENNRSIAEEIEEKYHSYPHNETLEKVFPDSKWIISSPEDLSLGLLYNSEKITHICYAKRGDKDGSFDHNASYYDGWWVVFEENE